MVNQGSKQEDCSADDRLKESIMKRMGVSVISESWFRVVAQRKHDLILKEGDKALPLIAIYGGSAAVEGDGDWKMSFEIGRELGRRGAAVINGGYGGVMEASARGVVEEGGVSVGITCDNLSARKPNRYIQHEWKLDRWDQRLLALIWLADGYIVMPGSSGTLVELSMVIETQNKGFVPARPIVCVGNYWESIVDRILGMRDAVQFSDDPIECVNLMLEQNA